MGVAKSKKLETIVQYLEDQDLVSDISLISRPHMRLYRVEDVHKNLQVLGCTKLSELILAEDASKTLSLTEGDTSDSSRISETQSF